jgi:predicted nucleic acid-binding OB-fold protein
MLLVQEPGAGPGEKVVHMDRSRDEIVCVLRHCGFDDVADAAQAQLPETVDEETADRFFAAHGLSISMLMDRMGGSP